MEQKKNNKPLIAIALALLVGLVGGTIAYFTSEAKQNVIGYVQIGDDRYVTLVKPNLFGRIKGRIDKRK